MDIPRLIQQPPNGMVLFAPAPNQRLRLPQRQLVKNIEFDPNSETFKVRRNRLNADETRKS